MNNMCACQSAKVMIDQVKPSFHRFLEMYFYHNFLLYPVNNTSE